MEKNVSKTDSQEIERSIVFLLSPLLYECQLPLNVLTARAVERFVKFTQASNNINNANAEKI